METTLYADVIGNITVKQGLIRIDLYNEVPEGVREALGEAEKAAPEYAFNRQLVMPVVSFIQSYPLIKDIMDQLVDKGAIRFEPKASRSGPAAPGTKGPDVAEEV